MDGIEPRYWRKRRSSCRRETPTRPAISSVVSGSSIFASISINASFRRGWRSPGAGHERNALTFLARAQHADAERIRDAIREFGAVFAADHREHEVDGGLTARASRAIAVDFENLLRDDGALELLGELLIGFPVHAHAIAGQLPRHREPPHAVDGSP